MSEATDRVKKIQKQSAISDITRGLNSLERILQKNVSCVVKVGDEEVYSYREVTAKMLVLNENRD